MASIKPRQTKKKGIVYDVTIEAPRSADGSRKQETKNGFATKKEAKQWISQKEIEFMNGISIISKKIKIAQHVDEYLESHADKVRDNTIVRYRGSAAHLKEHLGNIDIKDLKSRHLEVFFKNLKDGGASEASLKKVRVQVTLMLKYALQWEYRATMPFVPQIPKYPKKENIEVWDEKVANEFLNSIKNEVIYTASVIAFETGLRQAEVIGLTWDNIDFENKTLSVRKAYTYNKVKKTHEFSELKTEKSERTIKLFDSTIKLLVSEKAKLNFNRRIYGDAYNTNNSVCSMPSGDTIKPGYVSKNFAKLVFKSKCEKATFHKLRHTHASILLASNINIKIIQVRLGHSRIGVTLDTYAHLINNMEIDAINGVEKAFLVNR